MSKENDTMVQKTKDFMGMQGWVTWLASTGLVCLGLYKIYLGEYETGFSLFSVAGVAIGIGRKIDKQCEG